MSNEKPTSPFFAVSELITSRLRDRYFSVADKATCISIYEIIFQSLVEVFEQSGASAFLQNEAVNYAAQQFYSAILLNNTLELMPDIFDKLASVKNISTKELAFLAMFFAKTDFRFPIIEEIKLRS